MYCHCGKIVENKDLGLCASCAHELRKAERQTLKEKKPINKVSDKRGSELKQYAAIRQKFLLNKWCQLHGRNCIPSEIHHAKGRVGVNENGLPMLLDVRYFVPLCREAHKFIEENPKFAKDNGYSESRII
jgi:hypothetical protein